MLEFCFGTNISPVYAVVAETAELSEDMLLSAAEFFGGEFAALKNRGGKLYAYYLLMRLLQSRFDPMPLPLALTANGRGKPEIAGGTVHFNISHSAGLCAAAAAACPVGIDVQLIKPARPATMRYLCTGGELDAIAAAADRDRAFIQLWTYKESYFKALGCGLSKKLPPCEFDADGNIILPNTGYKTYRLDLPGFDKYCGALTVYAGPPVQGKK